MSSPTQEQILSFQMPKVEVGTALAFYPAGRPNAHSTVGFLVRISRTGRNVMLKTVDGLVYDAVRHVEDPKLEINSDHRENGAWDFTDEHKRLEKNRQELVERIERLELALTPRKPSVKKEE